VPTARLPHLRVTVPALILWGARDPFLRRSLATDSVAFCEDGRLLFLEEATHWVQHEEAERVNGLLDAFLRGGEVR
jgi:pimeloyl-ACP methyl ester carboxylesterase